MLDATRKILFKILLVALFFAKLNEFWEHFSWIQYDYGFSHMYITCIIYQSVCHHRLYFMARSTHSHTSPSEVDSCETFLWKYYLDDRTINISPIWGKVLFCNVIKQVAFLWYKLLTMVCLKVKLIILITETTSQFLNIQENVSYSGITL